MLVLLNLGSDICLHEGCLVLDTKHHRTPNTCPRGASTEAWHFFEGQWFKAHCTILFHEALTLTFFVDLRLTDASEKTPDGNCLMAIFNLLQ
jgi:hypothetical protein